MLDEQCETFVICNDGTMCWLCMYIRWNLCVGYLCIYDGTCVLAMIVIWMLVVYLIGEIVT